MINWLHNRKSSGHLAALFKIIILGTAFISARQLVQMEIQRRKNTGWNHNCCSPFSAKLKCGDCGSIDAEMEAVSDGEYV